MDTTVPAQDSHKSRDSFHAGDSMDTTVNVVCAESPALTVNNYTVNFRGDSARIHFPIESPRRIHINPEIHFMRETQWIQQSPDKIHINPEI